MTAERSVVFGSHGGLVGVLTEPPGPARPTQAVFLSNIGTHHRVGPFRLWVELARALAKGGHYVLRFDHAAMGDSDPRPGGGEDAERLQADMSEAMQWLARERGIEQFVVIGLCSGVTAAHNAAVADARVKAAVFIDGYTFPTPGFYLRKRFTRYLAPQRWTRYARRRLKRLREGMRKGADGSEQTSVLYTRGNITHDQFRADIGRMTERNARLLFIYTGTVNHHFNHTGQLYGMIGGKVRRANIEVDRFARADHLFSSLAERQKLVGRICAWIQKPPQ